MGTDGAIYIADWYDKRTGGHQDTDETCSGTIYRIVAKGTRPTAPKIDLESPEGQIAALKAPATNLRHAAFVKLKEKGAASAKAVAALLEDKNPYIAARAVWLLAQLGEALASSTA